MRLATAALVRLALPFGVVLLAAPVAAQQPFRVTAATPADNAVSVPLAGAVALTFSEPVAAAPALVSLPADSIQVGAPTISPDGLTVTYPVTRTANTRFVHLVLGGEAASGAALERPFAWNYTTAASNGTFRFGGTVTAEEGSPDAALVVLVGIGTDGSFSLADATVLDGATGAYTLGPVLTGIYTVGALRLPSEAPPRTFAFGFYDPNGDGTPDPALPLPFGTTNVTLREPQPVTARARYDEAATEAAAHAPDAAFFAVPETPVDTLGRAPLWGFTFYSPAQDSTLTVLATGLIPFTLAAAGPPEALAPILDGWVDSDVALAAAEGAGGAAFRAAHAGQPQALTLRGGLQPDVPTAATPAWRVAYRALDAGGGTTDSLVVYVHMMTGEVISTTAAEPGAEAGRLALEAAPNPATGPVSVAFRLERAGPARIGVYDALGREVAVLAEGPYAAGRHAAVWRPEAALPAGVYLVRLEAEGGVAVRAVALAR